MNKIKIIGIGGSGSNTISRMVKCKLQGPELIALNTDAQALRFCLAPQKILIGQDITRGLGTGMDPSLGEKAVLSSKNKIEEILKEADMIFITSGMGGGTGSPGAPIVAELAKSLGILTIAIVTKPFSFEGIQRKKIAASAIKKLEEKTDALLVISNDNLFKLANKKIKITDAFLICDDILKEAVQGITDLILTPGIININFADIKTIMKNSGRIFFGVGRGRGENRVVKAVQKAINSPLLDFSITGAKGVLFNISGQNVSLSEINTAAKIITENANPRAKIIFGAVPAKDLKRDEIKITLILTGF